MTGQKTPCSELPDDGTSELVKLLTLRSQRSMLCIDRSAWYDDGDASLDRQALDLITTLAQRVGDLEAEQKRCLDYANNFATELGYAWPAPDFVPLDGTLHLLTQIDNLAAGFVRRATTAEAALSTLKSEIAGAAGKWRHDLLEMDRHLQGKMQISGTDANALFAALVVCRSAIAGLLAAIPPMPEAALAELKTQVPIKDANGAYLDRELERIVVSIAAEDAQLALDLERWISGHASQLKAQGAGMAEGWIAARNKLTEWLLKGEPRPCDEKWRAAFDQDLRLILASPPPPRLDEGWRPAVTDLIAYANDVRWIELAQGMAFGGDDRARVASLIAKAKAAKRALPPPPQVDGEP